MAKGKTTATVAPVATVEPIAESKPTGNRRSVEVMQVLDEIHGQEEVKKEIVEYDHNIGIAGDEAKKIFEEVLGKTDGQEVDSIDDDSETDDKPDNNSSESEGDTETEASVQEKADDELPVIPEVLRRTALNLGVTPQEIQKVKNADDLYKIVEVLKSLPKEEQNKEPEEKEPEVDPLDEINLDPDEYEEDLVKGVNKLKDTIREQREQVKALLEKEKLREQELVNQNVAILVTQFDKTLDEINPELFGKSEDLKPDTDAYQNRYQLWDEAVKIGKALPDATMKEAIEIAGRKLFKDKFDSKASKDADLKNKLEKRSQSMLGKPSQREAVDDTPTTGKEAAVGAVSDYLKKIGLRK